MFNVGNVGKVASSSSSSSSYASAAASINDLRIQRICFFKPDDPRTLEGDFLIKICDLGLPLNEQLYAANKYLNEVCKTPEWHDTECKNLIKFAVRTPLNVSVLAYAGTLLTSFSNDFKKINEGMQLLKLAANKRDIYSMKLYVKLLNENCDSNDKEASDSIKRYYSLLGKFGDNLAEIYAKILDISDNKINGSELKKFGRENKELLRSLYEDATIKQNSESKYFLAKLNCTGDPSCYMPDTLALLSDLAISGHVNAGNLFIECLNLEYKKGLKKSVEIFFDLLEKKNSKATINDSAKNYFVNRLIDSVLPETDALYSRYKGIYSTFIPKIEESGYAPVLYSRFKRSTTDEERVACINLAKKVKNLFVLRHSHNVDDIKFAAELGDVPSLKNILEILSDPEEKCWVLDEIMQYSLELTEKEFKDYKNISLLLLLKRTLKLFGLDAGKEFKKKVIDNSECVKNDGDLKKQIDQTIKNYKAKMRKKIRNEEGSKNLAQEPELLLEVTHSEAGKLSPEIAADIPTQTSDPAPAPVIIQTVVEPAKLLVKTEIDQKKAKRGASQVQETGGGAAKTKGDDWAEFARFEDSQANLEAIFPEDLKIFAANISRKLCIKKRYINTGNVTVNEETIKELSHISIGKKFRKDGATLFGYLITPVDSAGKRDINNQRFKPMCVAQHISTTSYIIKACDPKSGLKLGQVVFLL
jgi:hypothetical protein